MRRIYLDPPKARKYDMHDDLMYNIPNWKFGMLHAVDAVDFPDCYSRPGRAIGYADCARCGCRYCLGTLNRIHHLDNPALENRGLIHRMVRDRTEAGS